MKIDKVADRNESMLKRRLPNKIKELRRDLCQLEALKDKGTRVERLNVVIEELRITATAAKVRRYKGWVDSYRQNRLFENNQRQFYRELDQEERCDDDQPVAEESKQFWETYGVSLQTIRMQSAYKTCKVKLMLKNRRK